MICPHRAVSTDATHENARVTGDDEGTVLIDSPAGWCISCGKRIRVVVLPNWGFVGPDPAEMEPEYLADEPSPTLWQTDGMTGRLLAPYLPGR